MCTTKEKIEVMQAYLDGKQIQHRTSIHSKWENVSEPSWHWYENEYRIKPLEPKIIMFEAWITEDRQLRWDEEGTILSSTWTRVPSEDKIIKF